MRSPPSTLREPRGREPIILFGHSLGGAIAIAAAAQRPCVRAVIAAATFARYWRIAAAKAWYVWPLAWMTVSTAFDPVDALPGIAPRPLLVIHGTADDIIPFEFGKSLYEHAREPKRFVEVRDGGHTIPIGEPSRFEELLCRFIADALQPKPSVAERRAEEKHH